MPLSMGWLWNTILEDPRPRDRKFVVMMPLASMCFVAVRS
jgi:hypothetical protein